MTTTTLPRAFIWRRLHSLTGLWIVLFLMEHLLTNSQAALLLGDNGREFVKMVNGLHNLPYLQVIEVALLGIPILTHMIWGVQYLFTAKSNSFPSKGNTPSLPQYGRNHAYTWQRITSWILLVFLIGHVVKFRFLEYPLSAQQGSHKEYFVRVGLDNGLYTVADRLGVRLYDQAAVEAERRALRERQGEMALVELAYGILEGEPAGPYDPQKEIVLTTAQRFEERCAWVTKLEQKPLSGNEVIAVAHDFGTATLLSVRDTFKNPVYVTLYTIFVLAACFHAFNGFWTFLITWGVILKVSAQKMMVTFSWTLMAIMTFLGLAAIWGTYWLNLKY